MKVTPEQLAEITNELYKESHQNINLINDIKQEAHKRLLIYSSLEKECIDEMIENGHYKKVIDKLQLVIEQLEGGYCKILDMIEGNEQF
jgi:hypothetical protein